jgi:predicted ferric reductase
VTVALLGVLNSKLAWYTARASGLVAWAVVTLSILWGLALSTRLVRRRGIPAWLLDLHRFLGTLSVVFVAVHIVALWADTFVYFGPQELFVPFASAWRPGAVAWGIAATYLLIAIQLTSWLMKKLPRKLWHSVHLTSFAMFVFATVHGFTSGADNKNLAVQWVALTGGLLVFLLVSFRLLAPRRAARTAAAAKRSTPRPDEQPSEAERIEAALRRRTVGPSRLAATDRGRAS